MRRMLLFCFLLFSAGTTMAQYFDTVHIYYDIGVEMPGLREKARLDSLARRIRGKRKILIYSYADYLGTERPNQHLSDRRALTAKSVLLAGGVRKNQVMVCSGLGQVPGSGSREGDPASRRTDIFIRKEPKKVVPPKVAKVKENPKSKAAVPAKPVPGPIPVKETLAVPDKDTITPINLKKIKVNQAFVLKHIQFYIGTPNMIPSSIPELNHLYQVMADNPRLKIRLEGHVCCCVYPDGYFDDTPTWQLSVQRALVVYQFLVKKGISPQRLQYKGFGRTHPIREGERTAEEGQVNRRVEARILAK